MARRRSAVSWYALPHRVLAWHRRRACNAVLHRCTALGRVGLRRVAARRCMRACCRLVASRRMIASRRRSSGIACFMSRSTENSEPVFSSVVIASVAIERFESEISDSRSCNAAQRAFTQRAFMQRTVQRATETAIPKRTTRRARRESIGARGLRRAAARRRKTPHTA